MDLVELYKIANVIIKLAPDAYDAVEAAIRGWGKATETDIDFSQLKPVAKDAHEKIDADIDRRIEEMFK